MTTLRFDPKSQITWEGARAAARGFLIWWRDTLWEMAPQSWRRTVETAFNRWTLTLDDTTWRLKVSTSPDEDLLLDPSVPDEDLAERIARFAATSREHRIDVIIPQECGLTRELRLPSAAQPQLRSVVGLQLDRLSPFRAEDVRFDCRLVGAGSADEIDVEVGIVPRQTLLAFERRLARLGLMVRRFRFRDFPFAFAPIDARRTPQERLQYVLAAIAVAMFAAAIMLAPMLRARELDNISTEIRSLRTPAHQAASLRDKLHRAAAPVDAANAILEHPGALDIMERLTKLLPTDVQLTELKIDGAAVRITGYGVGTGKLVALLRGSGAFQSVALDGPVGKAADGRDRFEIGMSAR